ncbi:MAG: hypothetical protein J6K76_03020 [Spirochaetaceae bacterium]|nr:hypothetical protein [Spirochaetaceae bacterium]
MLLFGNKMLARSLLCIISSEKLSWVKMDGRCVVGDNFKEYEDSSLTYTETNRHQGEKLDLYGTAISKEDFELLARVQD